MLYVKFTTIFIASIVLFTGCSIKQEVDPVTTIKKKEICIINNPPVRQGFLATYRKVLTNKGYKVKIIAANSPLDTCKNVSTYMGRWSWDVGIYMSYAKIEVFQNGQRIGNVLYDSRSGSANMSKFVNGNDKITELVNQLFP